MPTPLRPRFQARRDAAMIVDMHAHLYPERYMEELARSGGRYGVGVEHAADGRRFLRFEGIRFWWYVEPFYDVTRRLAAMDQAEVDLQSSPWGRRWCSGPTRRSGRD